MTPPLRVALVHPFSWPEVRRGGERYLDDLAGYLAGRGHHVELVTGTEGVSRDIPRADGVQERRRRHLLRHRLSRWGLGAAESFGIRAAGVLARRRVDVVHALMPTAALAGWLTRHPTVFTMIGHPSAEQLRDDPTERLVRGAVRRASAVTALSLASAAEMESLFGRRVAVVPPGVRLDVFTPVLDPRSGRPTLLFSAHLGDRRKRLDMVLAAFDRLLERRPDARLRLSGAGDHRWALDAVGLPAGRRERLNAAIEVMGPGELADVPGRYRQATLTVLAAEREAFGLALAESLACGTPVVCTADGGMPEIVGDDPVGRVVPTGDVDALVEAFHAVLVMAEAPDTPARCAARARRFGWQETVGPAHERLYRAAVDGTEELRPWNP